MIGAESRPSDADLGVRRLLSRSLRRIVLMTVVATLPLVAFPFRADERFAFYADSARFGANPFRVINGSCEAKARLLRAFAGP